ncbi:MAG: phage major capsid protein [Erysipelotrichia bacterium]|nr:phage major capsid protein [Erysipelotrichia bacterium]
MATQTMGTNFPAKLAEEIFSKVRDKSVLAKLGTRMPVAFTGTDVFTFSMDSDIALVGEGAAAPHGGITAAPVSIKPQKVKYQARVTNEFLTASDEAKIGIIKDFTDGYAKKLGRGLDLMGIHKQNPATAAASELITQSFDTTVTNSVAYNSATGGDVAIEGAVALLGDYDPTGLALSKTFAGILAAETEENGPSKFPELKWGGQPNVVRGIPSAVASTVGTTNYALVGDFDAFRWGYAKDITFKVIEFGNPDNAENGDLQATGQVMLVGEAYIGFGILDAAAFAKVVPAASV